MQPTAWTAERTSDQKLRVLVIDDDEFVGRALGRVLHAFEVTCTTSAKDALARIQAGGDFCAIVCDMIMPGMNGMQFYGELARSCPGLERMIVFLTGHRTTPVVADFLKQVPNTCLEKPFDAVALKAAIAGACAG